MTRILSGKISFPEPVDIYSGPTGAYQNFATQTDIQHGDADCSALVCQDSAVQTDAWQIDPLPGGKTCRCKRPRRKSDVPGDGAKKAVTSCGESSNLLMATSAAVVAVVATLGMLDSKSRNGWADGLDPVSLSGPRVHRTAKRQQQRQKPSLLEKIRSVKSTITDLQEGILKLQLKAGGDRERLTKAVEEWRQSYKKVQFRQTRLSDQPLLTRETLKAGPPSFNQDILPPADDAESDNKVTPKSSKDSYESSEH